MALNDDFKKYYIDGLRPLSDLVNMNVRPLPIPKNMRYGITLLPSSSNMHGLGARWVRGPGWRYDEIL